MHLLGHDATYTSHQFNNIYWASFKTYLKNPNDAEDVDHFKNDKLDIEYSKIITLMTNAHGHLMPQHSSS